ncbi:ABC-F family ATP-binding cassette domain-containing protein [Erysipelotrichaceae bacterium HCN-30851]
MLISVEHLSKQQNVKEIVNDVSFAIEDKDKIALIGVNGTGKTTLLRILAGVEHYDSGSIIRKNGLRISYLPQDPEFEENETILYQVLHMDKDIQEFEAKAILGKLGIHDTSAIVSNLSGGQRKRVALAKALLKPCDLLILDEPTNHLDNEMIEWLENYLIRFSHAILMVTHDRYFLERVCNTMLEIDRGKIYSYHANYSSYLQEKAERESILAAQEKKRQSILRKELAWVRAGVQARGTKSKERLERFQKLSEMESVKEQGSIVLDTVASRLGKKTIEIEHISKSYGEHVLFQDFSYYMTRNDRIGIIGPNGCGKSTLLKILAKDLEPDSGMVIHGDTVKIAYFRQGCEEMDLSKKVIEYITDTKNEIKTLEGTYSASQMLERFLFDSKMQYTPIGRLSGGERRRLYLLKVLMQEPNILFLDEPTNDLDIATLQILEDYLDNFPGAVIVVSHDRYFLDRICDKLFVFQNGSINQFIGGYSALMELGKQEKEVKEKKKGTKVQVIPRMTSKEKQELEEMEEKTSSLSEQLELLDEEMNQAGDDFTLIQELADKRAVMEKELEALMERWLYLEEKKEEIEEAKRK